MNPGVIFNDDPECCFKNFKALPMLSPAEGASEQMHEAFIKINKCIECGFCEVNCVSCGFTLSSRTRIALQREIASLKESGQEPSRLQALQKQYSYYGEQTCAGDGLCSMSCPMGINVGDLTHEIRRQNMGRPGKAAGTFAADHFKVVKAGLRGVLHLADLGHDVLGTGLMTSTGKFLHKAGLPLWTPSMPKAYNASRKLYSEYNESNPLKVVYFPSCLNQTMGVEKDMTGLKPLAEVMTGLHRKAGYEVIFQEKMDSLCCGTIWES
jgi:D-lactate dehydrogenase